MNPGLVFMVYRLHDNLCNAVLPPDIAHKAVNTAIAQGADYHSIQGIWDGNARKYKEPEGTSFVVLHPQGADDFEELDPPEILR